MSRAAGAGESARRSAQASGPAPDRGSAQASGPAPDRGSAQARRSAPTSSRHTPGLLAEYNARNFNLQITQFNKNELTDNDLYWINRLVSEKTRIPIYNYRCKGINSQIQFAVRQRQSSLRPNPKMILVQNASRDGQSHKTHFTLHYHQGRKKRSPIGAFHIKTENLSISGNPLTYQARVIFQTKTYEVPKSYTGIAVEKFLSVEHPYTDDPESLYDLWVGQVMVWAFEQVYNAKARGETMSEPFLKGNTWTRNPPQLPPGIEPIWETRLRERGGDGDGEGADVCLAAQEEQETLAETQERLTQEAAAAAVRAARAARAARVTAASASAPAPARVTAAAPARVTAAAPAPGKWTVVGAPKPKRGGSRRTRKQNNRRARKTRKH